MRDLSHSDYFDVFSSEFLKIFSSNGSEIFTRERCFEDHRDVVELQFGEGNFVTLQTQLYSRYSRLNLEFVLVRRSLHSGIPRKSLLSFCFSFNKKRGKLGNNSNGVKAFLFLSCSPYYF